MKRIVVKKWFIISCVLATSIIICFFYLLVQNKAPAPGVGTQTDLQKAWQVVKDNPNKYEIRLTVEVVYLGDDGYRIILEDGYKQHTIAYIAFFGQKKNESMRCFVSATGTLKEIKKTPSNKAKIILESIDFRNKKYGAHFVSPKSLKVEIIEIK